MQRLSHTTHQANRLRGGTVFSVAAKAGAAGSLASPSGGGFGQARYQTAPAAGRWGGGGRGCEYPGRPARQALQEFCGFLTTMLVMGWPVLVIGLAIANPPPAGVFAYIVRADELWHPPVLDPPDSGSSRISP
jgi:hypothetical protein